MVGDFSCCIRVARYRGSGVVDGKFVHLLWSAFLSLSLRTFYDVAIDTRLLAISELAITHTQSVFFLLHAPEKGKKHCQMKWKPYRDLIALVYWLIARVVKKAKKLAAFVVAEANGEKSPLACGYRKHISGQGEYSSSGLSLLTVGRRLFLLLSSLRSFLGKHAKNFNGTAKKSFRKSIWNIFPSTVSVCVCVHVCVFVVFLQTFFFLRKHFFLLSVRRSCWVTQPERELGAGEWERERDREDGMYWWVFFPSRCCFFVEVRWRHGSKIYIICCSSSKTSFTIHRRVIFLLLAEERKKTCRAHWYSFTCLKRRGLIDYLEIRCCAWLRQIARW